MGVVSLSLSCHDASADMQHDLLRSKCDLTWPCLRSNVDLIVQSQHVYVLTCLEKRKTTVAEVFRQLSLFKNYLQNVKNSYFDVSFASSA